MARPRFTLRTSGRPSSGVQMSNSDYDRREVHLRYDRARELSSETLRLWLERLARHLESTAVETVIDVGCGTGRFSAALAEGFAARVFGVDPSQKMLGVARERTQDARVEFVNGSAEELPFEDSFADLIFLSMVFHHIGDKAKACAEFARVLKASGRLAIRTTTRERRESFLWLTFFPEAREIEARRMPSRDDLIATVERAGFRLEAYEIVRQEYARDFGEYYEKIALRGLSTLEAISDDAFEEGLARLKKFCESQDAARRVEEEIDLFVFSKA